MISWAERLTEHRRLVLLLLLAESAGYSASAQLLHAALPGFGHQASRDRVETDLAWLAEQGLCAVQIVGGVHLAVLNQRGLDVAAGTATCPGVARPTPGA